MSSVTEAIDESAKAATSTTPSTPIPVTDVSTPAATTPAATTENAPRTVVGVAGLLNAPEGSTAINPATGKEMALSYKDMKDVPEGTSVIGLSKPATTVAEAIARVQAAERGEPDPYITY